MLGCFKYSGNFIGKYIIMHREDFIHMDLNLHDKRAASLGLQRAPPPGLEKYLVKQTRYHRAPTLGLEKYSAEQTRSYRAPTPGLDKYSVEQTRSYRAPTPGLDKYLVEQTRYTGH